MKWLPWLVLALFGFYLIGNNFQAKLGIIDDHEIAMFLGSDGRIPVQEIPSAIMSTEVGQWGSYLRYRPSYYSLRVIETALWRDNATLWYISRYVMLVASLWLGFKILSKYFPQIVAYLFIFYAMTMPFWPDLLTRLGPSEIYTVPSVLLFVYGLLTNRLWMIGLGYAICVGAKENFLILFPVLLGYFGYRGYAKKLNRQELITSIILSAYTLFIAAAILVATSTAGADIYGTQISYRYRITKFVWDIPTIIASRHLLPALLIMVVAPFIQRRTWKYVFTMLGIMAVIASQYIFYIDQLPSNTRYDWPALMLFPVLDLVAIKLLLSLFEKKTWYPLIKGVVYAVIILGCSLYVFRRGYTLVQSQSQKVVASSTQFATQLDTASEIIRGNPEAHIVFVSERYIDFEPIVSVSRYLSARRLTNTFALYYVTPTPPTDPMELHDRLTGIMHGEVGTDGIFDRFSAYNELDKPCYSLTFGPALPLPDCPEIARF